MSLKSTKKTYGVPKFNGNSEQFPMFRMKFDGLVFRLGRKYTKVLKGQKPYSGFTYAETYEESQFTSKEAIQAAAQEALRAFEEAREALGKQKEDMKRKIQSREVTKEVADAKITAATAATQAKQDALESATRALRSLDINVSDTPAPKIAIRRPNLFTTPRPMRPQHL